VADPKPEGVPPPAACTPVPHHEAERRAALVQASVLERRELVEPARRRVAAPIIQVLPSIQSAWSTAAWIPRPSHRP
jgi:hypothetical protein